MMYSPSPEINQAIEALLKLGCPPIPVAPKQNPRDEWCHIQTKTKEGYAYCPIDKHQNPIPRFGGKNPSYLDWKGSPRFVKHGEFQNRLPTDSELKKFFRNPKTGIGTLGGHAGVDWLDFDAKCYPSQSDCDADVARVINNICSHSNVERDNLWIERTGSGGWRLAVKPVKKPTFTNFATSPDGEHVGEALYKGRFTVLSPTVHPNGNPYRRIGWGNPVEVESLEAIGIFPTKDEKAQADRDRKREERKRRDPSYEQPTNPQDNPWDIRNFAHYFEGYHEKTDGWGYAKCPHHNGTSQTSFRVNLLTGQTKLWCGCDAKDVWRSGLDLAQSLGYKLPEKQNKTATITQDEWEIKHGFGKRLRKRIKQAIESFRGFGKPPTPKPNPQPKETPNQTFQDSNQRLKTWQDAIGCGYKYILDRSAPGLGKSHAVGVALPEAFNAEKLWYVANDHRNPTTGVVEANYIDLPVRHKGLKEDFDRVTPNGNPFLRHPQEGEEPDTAANCYRADLFQVFAKKGYNVEDSNTSPICGSCRVANLCSQGIGGKYGATFRGDRQSALGSERIRAHCDSLPSPGAEGFEYSQSGLFWDEVSTQLKPISSVEVSLRDFDRTFADLESELPEIHEALKPLRLAIRPLLSGEIKPPYHGWDDLSIRGRMPSLPKNLDELINLIQAVLKPDLSFLSNQPEAISSQEAKSLGISKGQRNIANRYFRSEAYQEFHQGFEDLPLNWLLSFLKLWKGERGAIRGERQKLIIYTHNPRYNEIIKAAKFNIFLDATISRDRLALLLDVDPSEIYVVEQETPTHGNLKVIQVTGMGKLGKDRSESLQQRVSALRAALSQQHPGIRFGDWKAQANEGDGQWFVNLRGSNEFQDSNALAVFGIPYQNIGYLQALYQTLTGKFAPLDKDTPHEGLQRFIDTHTQAEIEQAVGRLRSHLRPNEDLTFYFVGDYDLSFFGLPIEQREAFQITPEAGTPTQITRWKILEAVRQLQDQGQKITQDAIASTAKISQPLISKIARKFGGWQGLKKILLTLLTPLYSGSNNSAEWDEGVLSLAKDYLPSLLEGDGDYAIKEVAIIIECYGMPVFLRILASTPLHTQVKLLALLLPSFGGDGLGGILPYHPS